jgi:hypothetical protein
LVAAALALGFAIAVSIVGGYVFGWQWTGLAERRFWDWLKLLIVPAVLALGGYLFTRSENERARELADRRAAADQAVADQRAEIDRQLAEQRRQDDALQS